MLINIHTHLPDEINKCIVNTFPFQEHHHAFYSCGIHPKYVDDLETDYASLQQHLKNINCLAIGECGLDKRYKSTFERQKKAFAMQIHLANEFKKPIIIHCVRSSNEIINMLQQANNKSPILIHGFAQNDSVLQTYWKQNFFISIGASVLVPNSNAQKAVEKVSIKKLFLETDNSTLHTIESIYHAVAQIKNISVSHLEKQIETNFNATFAYK